MEDIKKDFNLFYLGEYSIPTLNTMNEVRDLINNTSEYSLSKYTKEDMKIINMEYFLINSKGILIYKGNKLIGFCSYVNDNKGLFIKNLFLNNKYQGKGLGTTIINSLIIENKCNIVYTKVKNDNQNAIAFYKKYGFKENGDNDKNHIYLLLNLL